MSTSQLANVDIEKAQRIWTEYQKQHDVSDQKGRTVGIDRPFYCVRVGRDYYLRKGGHR